MHDYIKIKLIKCISEYIENKPSLEHNSIKTKKIYIISYSI